MTNRDVSRSGARRRSPNSGAARFPASKREKFRRGGKKRQEKRPRRPRRSFVPFYIYSGPSLHLSYMLAVTERPLARAHPRPPPPDGSVAPGAFCIECTKPTLCIYMKYAWHIYCNGCTCCFATATRIHIK